MPNVVDLQRSEDPRDLVHRAVQVLAEGGVVGVPTDSLYAVVASGLSEPAVERLQNLNLGSNNHQVKGNGSFSKSQPQATAAQPAFPMTLAPMAIAIPSAQAAEDYMPAASKLAKRLARRCWPGPVLLLACCDQSESLASRLPPMVRNQVVAEDGCVGFRVVSHGVFKQLHRFLAGPIVIRSAYSPTGSPVTTGEQLAALVGDQVPLILDDGATRYGGPSTIVRVTGEKFEIVREGVVETAAITQFAKPLLAVVCTGNTCRSPMAEVMLRERFRALTGREDAVGVVSAGLAAFQGDRATNQAVEVMGRRGLDLTGHASQPMTEQILQLADVILTMTRNHRDAILSKYPEAADRVHTLRIDGGDISDPVGSPIEVYQACADQIDEQLAIWVDRFREHLGDPGSDQPAS